MGRKWISRKSLKQKRIEHLNCCPSRVVKREGLKSIILAGVILRLGVTISHAASATWNGTVNTTWATSGNWSTSPVPGLSDTATFNNAGNGNAIISLGSGVQINNVLFD